jgi:hypothetical protein
LGPLLFLIYINDLVHEIKFSNIRLFADDTCLFISNQSKKYVNDKLNEDLYRFELWSNRWLIKFSAEKTESLRINNKMTNEKIEPLFLNGHPIKEVYKHKHLGITISYNLKWDEHINDVVNSCSKRLNMLRSLKFKLNKKTLEIIYFAFIRPKMDYGCVLFAGSSKSNLDKLDKIEIECIRIITGATRLSHRNKMLNEISWQLLADRRAYFVLCQLYQIVYNIAPIYLLNIYREIQDYGETHNYQLRNKGCVKKPFSRSIIYTQSFFPYSISLWNRLDTETKSASSLRSFKCLVNRKYLDKKLNNYYKLLYYGERWASIHHCRLRIGCSALNNDLMSNLYVRDKANCSCGAAIEDAYHFFMECPMYYRNRQLLLEKVSKLCTPSIEVLLHGCKNLCFDDNRIIFDAVHLYINQSHRFEYPRNMQTTDY